MEPSGLSSLRGQAEQKGPVREVKMEKPVHTGNTLLQIPDQKASRDSSYRDGIKEWKHMRMETLLVSESRVVKCANAAAGSGDERRTWNGDSDKLFSKFPCQVKWRIVVLGGESCYRLVERVWFGFQGGDPAAFMYADRNNLEDRETGEMSADRQDCSLLRPTRLQL